jgi:hypothetical protein
MGRCPPAAAGWGVACTCRRPRPLPAGRPAPAGARMRVPFDAPARLLNRATVGAFNAAYYRRHPRGGGRSTVAYSGFFFPLDAVESWNRLYGRPGFLQYQCVVPNERPEALSAILDRVSHGREVPALAVLKRFGDVPSPGMLVSRPESPRGLAFRGRPPRPADALVPSRAAGGPVPAKDARMSGDSFRQFFPAGRLSPAHGPRSPLLLAACRGVTSRRRPGCSSPAPRRHRDRGRPRTPKRSAALPRRPPRRASRRGGGRSPGSRRGAAELMVLDLRRRRGGPSSTPRAASAGSTSRSGARRPARSVRASRHRRHAGASGPTTSTVALLTLLAV